MFQRRSFILWLAVLGLAGTVRAADGWAQLKKGMPLEQVAATLGAPLVKSQGRGLELWIYDHGGETLASYGVLTEWTLPKPPAKAPERKREPEPPKVGGTEAASMGSDGARATLRLPVT